MAAQSKAGSTRGGAPDVLAHSVRQAISEANSASGKVSLTEDDAAQQAAEAIRLWPAYQLQNTQHSVSKYPQYAQAIPQAIQQAQALAESALAAASVLQGRALLQHEAHDLLAAAGTALPAGTASWNAVLQLAALLGCLRLRSAIAAEEQPRRLFRARPRRRPRCQRCGSGEAQMRRTACAACGRERCAYCEACLGMGRARECGLLVLGAPAASQASPAGAAAAAGPVGPAGTVGAAGAAAGATASATAGAKEFAAVESTANLHTSSGSKMPFAATSASRAERPSYSAAEGRLPPVSERLKHWGLSPAQLEAAGQALSYIERLAGEPDNSASGDALRKTAGSNSSTASEVRGTGTIEERSFLLWAVTGAGKTEMIFPLIESVLLRGGRALVATPRRDVVLELNPRIRKAFPGASVVTLYGGSEQRWEQGSITLATTHQLLRFAGAFELVILDELDAFPYHGDPILHYAAEKSASPAGARVLLSATPPRDMRRAASKGRLPHARVPVRYHRHPLPVPALLRVPAVEEMIRGNRLPVPLHKAITASAARGAQIFLFVQKIRHVNPLVTLLRARFPQLVIDGTSSQDAERADKVVRFRNRDIRLLVTTTILERGVTVPKSDVIILDADGKLFDDASLIQMAGRAGRSADDPRGLVFFCGRERTGAQLSAIRQITAMNKTAFKKGYLLKQQPGKG
ncbi:DEAD/DEAH box helicase [Paenibacillaceae bacterium]|nr:DEAD/DEAH box helicase [Paenibacillaceae bacterium]